MAIYKELIGSELYVYMNGKLIYKRWLDTGASKVFDVMAYDKYTLTSIRDLVYENPNVPHIAIKARLTLLSPEEGGRHTAIISGYRPDHVFEYDRGSLLQAHIGDIRFEEVTIEPGQVKEVTVRFLLNQRIEQYLSAGSVWWIQEGPVKVGTLEYLYTIVS